jgi:hypothetical protein
MMMKKLTLIFMLAIVLLSACQAAVDFRVEGEGGDIGLLPGDLLREDEPDQQQQMDEDQPGRAWFTEPFVIVLLIALVVLLIVVVFSQARRPR